MQIESMLDTALAASVGGCGSFVDNLDALRRAMNFDNDYAWFAETSSAANLTIDASVVEPPTAKGHRRAGITKNKGRGKTKEYRKTARHSRRVNRHL